MKKVAPASQGSVVVENRGLEPLCCLAFGRPARPHFCALPFQPEVKTTQLHSSNSTVDIVARSSAQKLSCHLPEFLADRLFVLCSHGALLLLREVAQSSMPPGELLEIYATGLEDEEKRLENLPGLDEKIGQQIQLDLRHKEEGYILFLLDHQGKTDADAVKEQLCRTEETLASVQAEADYAKQARYSVHLPPDPSTRNSSVAKTTAEC